MPLNSFEFIFLFLPLAVLCYWKIGEHWGRRPANAWLLFASVVFYAYASLLGLAIIGPALLIDYAIAKAMQRPNVPNQLRNALCICGVMISILFLAYFKYRNFFVESVDSLLALQFQPKQLPVPLGLSFLVFQKISFLCDVRSGRVKDVSLSDLTVFMLLFPRALAGPITRYEEVIPQLRAANSRNVLANLSVGICLLSIGLFKKAVIADGLTDYVQTAFDTPSYLLPPTLIGSWIGALAFTLQIYFDFSGYSDMASGAARMFGIKLPANFNSPFRSTSIVEFWSRWHMSLTRFLTAYLYTPITVYIARRRLSVGVAVRGGREASVVANLPMIAIPTLSTMTIAGIWHGAGWQYLVFGVLHGTYLTINQLWKITRLRSWISESRYAHWTRPIGAVLTLLAVVIAFVFFRARSVTEAWAILGGMIGLNGFLLYEVQLLHHVGISVPFPAELAPDLSSLLWIATLFIAVILLPNSLEILQRYEPALDFEKGQGPPKSQTAIRDSAEHAVENQPSVWTRVLVMVSEVRHHGITLGSAAAFAVSLLFVWGSLALDRGARFIYLKF